MSWLSVLTAWSEVAPLSIQKTRTQGVVRYLGKQINLATLQEARIEQETSGNVRRIEGQNARGNTRNLCLTPNPAMVHDGHVRLKVTRDDDLPIVRFVCIVCVDKNVPDSELMGWEMELQMFRQKSALLPNCAIFGQTSDETWIHGLRRQALPGSSYASPTTWTNLNEKGRFAWVDILLPEEFCGYDGHLVLRRLAGHTINVPSLTIISYMTYEHKGVKCGTPPTRA